MIDLLEPYLEGGKIGLFGGAGVGKTVLITEMINRLLHSTAESRCSQAWENEPVKALTCYLEMEESGVLEKTALVFGQMDEPPGVRLRVALSALTMAEYFATFKVRSALVRGQYFSALCKQDLRSRLCLVDAFSGGLPAQPCRRDG